MKDIIGSNKPKFKHFEQEAEIVYELPSTNSQKIWAVCKPFLIFTLFIIIILLVIMLTGWYNFNHQKLFKGVAVIGDESLMDEKQNGSCVNNVQDNALYKTQKQNANKICCHNRRYAEPSKYWEGTSFKNKISELSVKYNGFVEENKNKEWKKTQKQCPVKQENSSQSKYIEVCEQLPDFLTEEQFNEVYIEFYDIVTGKPLFFLPSQRNFKNFIQESILHGWPSFRDNEVVWDNVRVIEGGETVSFDGTHLGHNIPDKTGNRYCINLICISGIQIE